MDELEGQIRQVLGDPAQMAQIMGLAQSLLGGGTPEAAPPPPSGGGLGELPGPLTKPPKSAGDQQALLQALRPYLSDKRQKKLDRAMQLTRMARLAKTAIGGLGGAAHG